MHCPLVANQKTQWSIGAISESRGAPFRQKILTYLQLNKRVCYYLYLCSNLCG